MSYLALYRKYRPVSFDNMVGQNEVVDVLKKEILQNRISHAYLFCGPRGTGKTSTAKIVARMVNCANLSSDGVPCGKCDFCLNFNSSNDIVEIDAASNNGVDEIRDLRDKVNLVPSNCKYKVYIIDEVHMLTTQAFNALLKTLEEPPSHVIFILATTEFYKIPVTVVSRCQKFQFSKVSNDSIVVRLKEIAKNEKIKVSDECLYEIARLSDGGMRDAINMLDQLASFSDNNIALDDIYRLAGTYSKVELENLLLCIFNKDYKKIISFVEELNKNGKNINKFIEEIISFIRDIIYYKLSGEFLFGVIENIDKISDYCSVEKYYELLKRFNDLFNDVKNSSVPYVLLSVSLINISKSFDDGVNNASVNQEVDIVKKETVKDVTNSLKKRGDTVNPVEKKTVNIAHFVFSDELKNIRINNTFCSASKEKLLKFKDKWTVDELLFDKKYSNVAGLLKDVDVIVVGDNNAIFLVNQDSLIDRLYDNIVDIERMISDKYNYNLKIVFLTVSEWNIEKKKYIDNLKNGYKYLYIEEKNDNLDSLIDVEEEKKDDDIDKIVDIIGDEVIKYI